MPCILQVDTLYRSLTRVCESRVRKGRMGCVISENDWIYSHLKTKGLVVTILRQHEVCLLSRNFYF